MKTDIEIAQSCPLLPITAIGAKLGLTEEQLECYGRYKAKLLPSATAGKPQTGKLILVTAINPTAAGEGKTTTSIGLADSLSALGKKTVLALREPSLDLYGPPAPQTAHHSNIASCSRSHCAPGAFLHFGAPLPRCRGPPFSRFASPPNLEKRRTENVVSQ